MIIHIHSVLPFTRMIVNTLTVRFKHCNTQDMTEVRSLLLVRLPCIACSYEQLFTTGCLRKKYFKYLMPPFQVILLHAVTH